MSFGLSQQEAERFKTLRNEEYSRQMAQHQQNAMLGALLSNIGMGPPYPSKPATGLTEAEQLLLLEDEL